MSYMAIPGLKFKTNWLASSENKANTIIDFVLQVRGLSLFELMKRSRKKEIAYARHLCMYLIKKHTKLTLLGIGQLLGENDGYHYSTVIHGVSTFKKRMMDESEARTDVVKIECML